MSSILGIFNLDGNVPDMAAVRRMSGAMAARGADRVEEWRDESAVLAVSRNAWELEEGFSGPVTVLAESGCVVAADASLYYKRDLTREIEKAGVKVGGSTPSHLILAAYRAWGAEGVHRLEGDFAFVLWDRMAKRVLCARDYFGTRPLYYHQAGNTLVVASSVSGVLACPGVSQELNLVAIAEAAGGGLTSVEETAYRGTHCLLHGKRLTREGRGAVVATQYWAPPRLVEADGPPFEEARLHLLDLLCAAAEERMAASGPTGIWLSGGWDSTAVFGASEKVLRDRGRGEHLHPVSLSYPPGDPGREDEFISDVVGQWGSPHRWVDAMSVPLLENAEARAARRDEPFAHAYEPLNRAMAVQNRASGARVTFDGTGGDVLFQVSIYYLADLLWSGRWTELAREWRGKGMTGMGFWTLFDYAIEPELPDAAFDLVKRVRPGAPPRHLQRRLPRWLDRAFAAREDLDGRMQRQTPVSDSRRASDREAHFMMALPYYGRIAAVGATTALEEGVERRSPLYDQRVMAFAATRPRWERSSGAESKILLRGSMRGLLPQHILAPRKSRTGLTSGYFDRGLRFQFGQYVSEIFRNPVLAELGLVDGRMLRRAWADLLRRGDERERLNLYLALQTELWLRARVRGAASARPWTESIAV